MKYVPVKERLMNKTVQDPEGTGCWIWTGHVNSKGYGSIRVERNTQLVHRVAWTEYKGPIPEGLCVLHKCDNPACWNLEHLFLGTTQDNTKDMMAKGRNAPHQGQSNPYAVLNDDKVREIHRLLQQGVRLTDIANKFRIGKSTVSHIKFGENWTHIYKEFYP